MRERLRVGLRRLYGAGPRHLFGYLVAFGISAYAFARILSDGGVSGLVFWLLVLVVAHDLIFVPAYVAVDHILRRAIARVPLPNAGIPAINHVRAPALISGLLLIIYSPLITGLAGRWYFTLSGRHLTGYLRNWLLITAGLFLASALIYVLRVARARARPTRRTRSRFAPHFTQDDH
jgi:hypothetical protein